MPKGILYVESRPASPKEAADFHRWYDETHIPEILKLDGFVSARRFEPLGGDGSFAAIYEIDTDVETARATLTDAMKKGSMSPPSGVQLDPPPSVRFFRDITADKP